MTTLTEYEDKLEILKGQRGKPGINEESRTTEMKKIRREIRKLRDPSEKPVKEKKNSGDKAAARKTKRESREATGRQGGRTTSPQMIRYIEDVPKSALDYLRDTAGLRDATGSKILYEQQGCSFALQENGESPEKQAEQFVAKYRARFTDYPLQWFTVMRQGPIQLIVLGPAEKVATS